MSLRLLVVALLVLVAFGAVAAYFAWTLPVARLAGELDARNKNVVESLGKPMDERFRLIDHFGGQVARRRLPERYGWSSSVSPTAPRGFR